MIGVYNKPIQERFAKGKKGALMHIFAVLFVVLCVVIYAVFSKPAIERHTWVLFSAQQAEPPHFVVAYNQDYNISDYDSTLFAFAKPIELTCIAKDGRLTLIDKTNDKTYSGTYKVKSWSRFSGQKYSIIIDGKEGTANISSRLNRTLFVSLDNYYLQFDVK